MVIELNKEKIKTAFNAYVSKYDAENPKIRLKIDHTFRVADLCERIAKDIAVDKNIAWLCGMLHDFGRFEQVRRYNTFSDADSVDHAELGADLLFKDCFLDYFGVQFDEEGMQILEKAVRNHSTYRLGSELNEIEIVYCNILRDADKIDIFRVNCDTPLEKIYNISSEELRRSPVSDEVKQCFIKRTAVLRKLKQYPADYVVGHICLTFELVYPLSKIIAHEQGYVDNLLSFQSNNEDTIAWFNYMKQHVWE